MSRQEHKNKVEQSDSKAGMAEAGEVDDTAAEPQGRPKEVDGRGGLDPTRYGDWEKAGRCIDF